MSIWILSLSNKNSILISFLSYTLYISHKGGSMFCLTGPTSDLLATSQCLCRTLYFYVDQKSKSSTKDLWEKLFNIYFSESVEPFKRKLCLNIPWMVQSSTNFCVFWADKNSNIVAIAGQSFNIGRSGPYWVNWIDICFQKLQTFDYTKTVHKWSLDGPEPT